MLILSLRLGHPCRAINSSVINAGPSSGAGGMGLLPIFRRVSSSGDRGTVKAAWTENITR